MHSDCDSSRDNTSLTRPNLGPADSNSLGLSTIEHAQSGEGSWISTSNSESTGPSSQNNSNPYFNAQSNSRNSPRLNEPIYLGPETESEMVGSQDTRQRTAGSGFRLVLVAILIGAPIVFVILSVSTNLKSSRSRVRKTQPHESHYEFTHTTADMSGLKRPESTVTLSQWKDETTYPKLEIDLTETLKNDPARREFPAQIDSIELSGKKWSESRYLAIENSHLLKKLHYSKGLITPRLTAAIQNKSLFELYLVNCKWDEGGAIRFTHPGFRKLFSISLSGTPVTPQILIDLTACYQLEELYLQQSNVGDFAIDSINDFVRLKKLDLSGTKVTFSGLRKLRSESLEELTISSTQWTPTQHRLIKRNNPNLKRFLSSSGRN
ncbi:hypothetical protein N8550_00690 [Pirellulaceae bacterium]|nr:hypothetical protein [Pirellulaceae bacterium]